jgi:hypothetical protein
MPFVSKRSPLTPANARAADVASRLSESISPMQQQRMIAAFRVQGFQCILYNRLQQGRPCPCCTKNATVNKLSPDGKADVGAINRVITGQPNFGITTYNPQMNTGPQGQGPTSANPNDPWAGDLTKPGKWDTDDVNFVADDPMLGDNGQFSPDLEDIFGDFDMTQLGFTDISCPVCFGTMYVGGYSVFRGMRHVLIPQDFKSASTIDIETWALEPGRHTARVALPKGANQIDAFRIMNGRKPAPFQLLIDGVSTQGKNLLQFFDGREHELTVITTSDMTHMEIQAALSTESVYFEFPRRQNSDDISKLERMEPFQLLMSPDVPQIDVLDVVVESQQGKTLVVGAVNPWETHRRNPLGIECQVRVSQPQELFNILPVRNPLIGDRASYPATPAKSEMLSGVGIKSFKF